MCWKCKFPILVGLVVDIRNVLDVYSVISKTFWIWHRHSQRKRSFRRMHTIHDVAKAAGVSITTVSRALNGYGDVSEKTRQRIVSVARDLGYHANAAARNLRGKRTDTIAFAPYLYVES